MIYRQATAADCRIIYDLICDMECKALPYEVFSDIYQEQLSSAQHCFLLGTQEDEVWGFIHLRMERQLHHCEPIAEIMEFVVASAHRSKGVGSVLLAEACMLCTERGCAQIEVACNQLRHDTHRFYLRQGMHNFHYKFSKRLVGPDECANAPGR